MRFQRPVRCHVIAAGMVLVTPAAPAHAKSDFPVKAIRLVVPGSGQIDALARVLGSGLSERLGQPVVIHNVLGAGGILAAHNRGESDRLGRDPASGCYGSAGIDAKRRLASFGR